MRLTITLAVSLFASFAAVSMAADNTSPDTAPVEKAFGKLPLYFIENQGQIDSEDVAYYVKGADETLYFTKEGITFSLRAETGRWTVKLDFVGANPDVAPRGEDRQKAVFSYFKGAPEDWNAGCPTYAKVFYEELWPGIDLVYSGTVNELKYEFVVEPGADPGVIRLAYRGASEVVINECGELVVSTPVAGLEDGVPYAYQEIDGELVEVDMAYSLGEDSHAGSSEYGFEVGEYDRALPLILDPELLVYCGYIGGNFEDICSGIELDSDGAAYVAGYTYSPHQSFPEHIGPDMTYNGSADAFVAKVDPSGVSLAYCGYIGGSESDKSIGIAVDADGAAYVTGDTQSSPSHGFPVLVGPELTFDGGYEDAFVAKINPSGTALEYCGYIGGTKNDSGIGIAIDANGAAYVIGTTKSSATDNFPLKKGPSNIHRGKQDAFVAKVSRTGDTLRYCGYIGGEKVDDGRGIAVDASGAAYVTGRTESYASQGFPVLVGPDLNHNGAFDGYVAKVNPSGESLEYCGYLGGTEYDSGEDIAVDFTGAAYIAGRSFSSESQNFPVNKGPDLTFNGGDEDAFVAKVSPSGSTLTYCGYIGGMESDRGAGVAVDGTGAAFVTGFTESAEFRGFPVLVGPDLTFNGNYDAFVAKVASSGASLEYCGYIGGNYGDSCSCIDVEPDGTAYVAGDTDSSESDDFPVLVGPDLTYNDDWYCDGFVAKLSSFDAPLPDIRANNDDGPLFVTASDDVTVAIRLDPGSLDGEHSDWWIGVQRDGADSWWAQYRSGQKPKWTKSVTPIRFAGAALRTVNNYTVLGPRTLPAGTWVFGFSVDHDKDDIYDASFTDTVKVVVN